MTSSKIIALVIINNRGDNYMINVKVIGKIIKKMRENKGLTQEVLSGLAGLDHITVKLKEDCVVQLLKHYLR